MTQLDSTPTVITYYLEITGLSMRDFGAALECSHASISQWAAGNSEPKTEFLMGCMSKFQDWRHDLAQHLLALRFPGTWIIPDGSKKISLCDVCGAPKMEGHAHG
jgi:transcriptional regulator with XRE-family HTH domain